MPSGSPVGQEDWTNWGDYWETYDPLNEQFLVLADNFTLMKDITTRWNYNRYGYFSGEPSSKIVGPQVRSAQVNAKLM